MNNKQMAAVAGVVVAVVAVIVVLLATGGEDTETSFDDPIGDVALGEGSAADEDLTLADILHAEVHREGEDVVFEMRLARTIPEESTDQDLDLRWELAEDGDTTWFVFANLDFGPNAYIVSEETDYGSSTIDKTFPGSVEVRGDILEIRLRPGEIAQFPTSFEWHLETTLIGNAIGTDRAPDDGAGELES
ncbi:MAG: hypothetical protein ACRDJI_06195 [Actinomycetota bacterium]